MKLKAPKQIAISINYFTKNNTLNPLGNVTTNNLTINKKIHVFQLYIGV